MNFTSTLYINVTVKCLCNSCKGMNSSLCVSIHHHPIDLNEKHRFKHKIIRSFRTETLEH